jgi:hypothetical protein
MVFCFNFIIVELQSGVVTVASISSMLYYVGTLPYVRTYTVQYVFVRDTTQNGF